MEIFSSASSVVPLDVFNFILSPVFELLSECHTWFLLFMMISFHVVPLVGFVDGDETVGKKKMCDRIVSVEGPFIQGCAVVEWLACWTGISARTKIWIKISAPLETIWLVLLANWAMMSTLTVRCSGKMRQWRRGLPTRPRTPRLRKWSLFFVFFSYTRQHCNIQPCYFEK